MNPISSEPTEEREGDMSNLAPRFSARMRKWAVSTQGETILDFEASGDKHLKRYGLDEEAQKSPTVIIVDYPERASDALLAWEGAAHDASKEACALLEDGALTRRPPNPDQAVSEASSTETIVGLPL